MSPDGEWIGTLHFDGSCWPNPGGPAKYGWVLEAKTPDKVVRTVAEDSGPVWATFTSNNVAEWRALEAGLRWLARSGGHPVRLNIRGDSRIVISRLTARKVKGMAAHLKPIREECLRLLDVIGCPWGAQWVPREENSRADALSKR
jgi:ribonuclease HI